MARIISVHGTFSSGPERGDKWWQHDSETEKHLKEMLVSDSDDEPLEQKSEDITFEPFIWDGQNSEQSRRRAGLSLFKRLCEIEKTGEKYTLIGHSHGGSVISDALLHSDKKNPLENLSNWITVGTPFIVSKRYRFIFTRLTPPGKAAYMLFAYVVFALLTSLLLGYRHMSTMFLESALLFFAVSVLAAIAMFFLFKFLFTGQERKIKKKWLGSFATSFDKKWIALWHKNDEAIQGLTTLKKINIEPFEKNFSVPALSLISIFILPLLLLIFSIDERTGLFINELWRSVGAEPIFEIDVHASVLQRILATFLGVFLFPLTIFEQGTVKIDDIFGFIIIGAGLLVSFFILWLLSMAIYYVVSALAHIISYAISKMLNKMTGKQLRRSALGGDAEAEYAISAQNHPQWLSSGRQSLPAALDQEIISFSNEATYKAIEKIRNTLSTFAMAEHQSAIFSTMSEYLSWKELIHTSYFDIEHFRKLLAYAVAQGDGFEMKGNLRADPEFETIKKWYNEIKQQEI